jgi:hypothetical protein
MLSRPTIDFAELSNTVNPQLSTTIPMEYPAEMPVY